MALEQHLLKPKQYLMNERYFAMHRRRIFPFDNQRTSNHPMKTYNVSSAIAGTLLIALSLPLSAATLMGDRTTVATADPAFNLTSFGSSDWAYWETTANPAASTPTDEKSGAAIISSMTAVGGGDVRGSSSTDKAEKRFYVDGRYKFGVWNPVGCYGTFQ